MKYLALDQNQWIQLDEARLDRERFSEEFSVLEFLAKEVESSRLIVPLFQSNIYETHKIDDPDRRVSRAQIQCVLSDGRVMRGYSQRRAVEVRRVLAHYFDIRHAEPEEGWFLSDRFWEAASLDSSEVPVPVVGFVDDNPGHGLFDYLVRLDDAVRRSAVRKFSAGCADLLSRIEKRRTQMRGESLSMRRRILSAQLWLESQDGFWEEVDGLGIATDDFKASSNELKRDLVRMVPSLHVERELSLVLEAETTGLTENDIRDMEIYTAAIPHMHVVAGERGFVSRSKQAGLDTAYGVSLTSDLLRVPDLLGNAG